jgi:hypothetical protein
MEELAQMNLSDLPQKDVFNASRIPVKNKKVIWWINKEYGEIPEGDTAVRSLLSTALDSGKLKAEQVKEWTGQLPIRARVRFDQWWVTASMQGMVAFIAASVRVDHPDLTREQVARWPFASIAEAARKVEKVTAAAMGNI